jgi:hypothetical protein
MNLSLLFMGGIFPKFEDENLKKVFGRNEVLQNRSQGDVEVVVRLLCGQVL